MEPKRELQEDRFADGPTGRRWQSQGHLTTAENRQGVTGRLEEEVTQGADRGN